jgi:hypothetical protein
MCCVAQKFVYRISHASFHGLVLKGLLHISISKQTVCAGTRPVESALSAEEGERNAGMEMSQSSIAVLRDIKWWVNSCRSTFPPPYETKMKKKKKKMGGTRQLPL